MKAIDPKAATILTQLTQELGAVGDHRRFDQAPGVFMAACVEYIHDTDWGGGVFGGSLLQAVRRFDARS